MKHLSRAPLYGRPLALSTNIRLGLEKLAKNKHSSLLRNFVNCVCKKIYRIGPRVVIRKTAYEQLTLIILVRVRYLNIVKTFWVNLLYFMHPILENELETIVESFVKIAADG